MSKFVKPVFFLALIFSFAIVHAQTKHGLEKIIVEKYYVSDANDANAKGGHLPVGSVTYRIYVDMLPAYRLQAVYGVTGHELRIATTTAFFNNEEYGAAIANEIPREKLEEGTVMLDSWLSVGAAAEKAYAVLKSEDTSKVIVNKNGLLQNTDASAGIPVKERDGFYPTAVVPVVAMFGIDTVVASIFGKTNSKIKGQVFNTDNGSWASFGGAIGATPQNRVLIAQITTDGEFSFEINLQIGTPEGKVENYVAKNPVGNEIQFEELIYPKHSEKKQLKLGNTK